MNIEEQKEIINNFREQNFELREDLGTYKNQYNKLFDENKQLKNDLLRAEAMEDYWKINSSELEQELKEYR